MRYTGAMVWVAFLGVVQAEPPKIEFPRGHLVVTHGKTVVEFLPDGSTRVISPVVSITIPGKVDPDNPLPPNPKPDNDDLKSTVAAMFGADVDPDKEQKLTRLVGYWKSAIPLVKNANTLGDLVQALRGLPSIPADDLRPIRELFRDKIRAELGSRADAPLDQAKAVALFGRFVAALEGVRQ